MKMHDSSSQTRRCPFTKNICTESYLTGSCFIHYSCRNRWRQERALTLYQLWKIYVFIIGSVAWFRVENRDKDFNRIHYECNLVGLSEKFSRQFDARWKFLSNSISRADLFCLMSRSPRLRESITFHRRAIYARSIAHMFDEAR